MDTYSIIGNQKSKTCIAKFWCSHEKKFLEESRSLNKVIDFVSICQSSATKCVPERNSTIRGETNVNDHDISN